MNPKDPLSQQDYPSIFQMLWDGFVWVVFGIVDFTMGLLNLAVKNSDKYGPAANSTINWVDVNWFPILVVLIIVAFGFWVKTKK